jgi:hypothetical protein
MRWYPIFRSYQRSRSCPLRGMFVSLLYTTMNQTPSWLSPSQTFLTNLSLRHIKSNLIYLKQRDIKIQLNVMDNQACNVVKTYLATKGCHNMIVEPNNHRVDAAERAIQTFKAHFISALATTDSGFLLQLWDCLTLHVTATLNMLRPSQLNPSKSAYNAMYGPYNWNCFPLAPPGCKAVIYESPGTRGSWASHGTDAW